VRSVWIREKGLLLQGSCFKVMRKGVVLFRERAGRATHLHGLPQVVAAPLLLDARLVNLASGDVVVPS
jgi:hypothetical protein